MGRAFFVALVLTIVSVARADRVRLEYRNDRCADAATLRDAVVRELHLDPFGEPARYVLSATVRTHGGSLHALIELRDGEERLGVRELDARDCEELLSAMAWVIALAVEPLTHPPTSPPDIEANPEAPVEAPKVIAPLPALGVPPRRTSGRGYFSMRIGVEALLPIDAGPTVTAGFAVSVAAVRPHYSLGLDVRADVPLTSAHGFGGSVSTNQVMAILLACVRHRIFAACPLVALGGEFSSSSGYTQPQSASTFYASLGGRVQVEAPLRRLLWLRVHADLLAALSHQELYVGDTSDIERRVYRTPEISSAIGAALLVEIP